jgi:hypothetical protein
LPDGELALASAKLDSRWIVLKQTVDRKIELLFLCRVLDHAQIPWLVKYALLLYVVLIMDEHLDWVRQFFVEFRLCHILYRYLFLLFLLSNLLL